jgi:hypothetical protein
LCVWEKRRHTHTQLIRSRELKAPLIPHTNTHTHKHKHTQLRSSKLSTIVLGGLFQTFSFFFWLLLLLLTLPLKDCWQKWQNVQFFVSQIYLSNSEI